MSSNASYSRPRTPCAICGGKRSGHVIVKDRKGEPWGEVCSSHTLAEIILHPSDHITAEVIALDPEEVG